MAILRFRCIVPRAGALRLPLLPRLHPHLQTEEAVRNPMLRVEQWLCSSALFGAALRLVFRWVTDLVEGFASVWDCVLGRVEFLSRVGGVDFRFLPSLLLHLHLLFDSEFWHLFPQPPSCSEPVSLSKEW